MESNRMQIGDERTLAGQDVRAGSQVDEDLMPEAGLEIDPEDLRPKPMRLPDRRRVAMVLIVLLGILVLAVVPPLISLDQFRRRIAQGVSEGLGRPVHVDSVSLMLLPMPGFELNNFVVTEDPAFGSEPIIQARSVRVTLRVGSLWQRRLEFSRISLDDPSVNLVHRADGHWNIESILLSAAKIDAAPTAQANATDAPRFPYIHATGARLNIKNGLEKMPLALTEADLSLWLPEPGQWSLRLEGHPTRTDTAPTDTGTVRLEGTLGKASGLAEVPVNLSGEWRDAPMGGASNVVLGRDAGFRGGLTLRASIHGTAGHNTLETRLELTELRRADFVPAHTLDTDITCRATAVEMFHRFTEVHCGWPSAALLDLKAAGLDATGEIPNAEQPRSVTAQATIRGVPASAVLDALRLGSTRLPPQLSAEGTISGELACCATATTANPWAAVTGTVQIAGAKLSADGAKPFVDGEITGEIKDGGLALTPGIALDLGAPTPALLEGSADLNGYQLHLSGAAMRDRLLLLARAVPQFGDGLEEALPPAVAGEPAVLRLDLLASRTWAGGQTWRPEVKVVRPRRHGKKT